MDKYLFKSGAVREKISNDKQGTKLKYKEDSIEYGFICSGPDDDQFPFCLICRSSFVEQGEVLVPSKLKRHLKTKHPTVKDKPKGYFENLATQQNKRAKTLTNYNKLPEKKLIEIIMSLSCWQNAKKCIQLALIRFKKDAKCVNEYLFCKDMKTTTTGKDIFKLVNENILLFKVQWKNCISAFSPMDGLRCREVRRDVSLSCVLVVHCMIHRETLAFKYLPKNLLSVLNQSIKVVNLIKSRPLHSRLFSQLCEVMDSDY